MGDLDAYTGFLHERLDDRCTSDDDRTMAAALLRTHRAGLDHGEIGLVLRDIADTLRHTQPDFDQQWFDHRNSKNALGAEPARSERVELARDVASVEAARSWVERVLERWSVIDADLRHAVVVVADELVRNAVAHGAGSLVVSLFDGAALRVAVVDASTTAPPRSVAELSGPGRGLRIVDAYSAQWGTRLHDHGKEVWADVVPTH